MLKEVYIRGKKVGKIIYANTLFLKLKGLMFTKNPNYGALLLGVNSIHMFFVFSPLRIFWLSDDMKVIKKEIAYPWRMYSCPSASHVLELPMNMGKEIKEGDKIEVR